MTSPSTAKKDIQKLQRAIADGLEDVKAQDIVVFNTEELSPLFERVIIASGTSNRQTRALAQSVREAVCQAGFDKPRMEGQGNGEWIIVDCGAAVVHVMQAVIRQYYRLEELWGGVPVRLKLGGPKPRSPSLPSESAPPARRASARAKPGAAAGDAPRRASPGKTPAAPRALKKPATQSPPRLQKLVVNKPKPRAAARPAAQGTPRVSKKNA